MSTYFEEMREADEILDEALGHIRAEEAAGNISAADAATERVGLLQRHIDECRRLRAEYFGVSIPPVDGGS